ncbi:hypothetical protein LPN04_26320 [Rugamonas sp. A1-17]|nr:hypothetical protein [Rugamonas sp. A1-17]
MFLLAALLAGGAAPSAHAGDALWITHPEAPTNTSVVLHLHHALALNTVPASLFAQVSADNRFILYVNGQRVASGPATSDLAHWRYERIDLAPFLRAGGNDIAAVVWNFTAPSGPLSQISARTGFYFKVEDDAYAGLNSGPGWKTRLDRGHKSASGMEQMNAQIGGKYYVAASPETIDAASADWEWAGGPLRADGRWLPAVDAAEAGKALPWTLTADPLPPMHYRKVDSGKVVRTDLPGAEVFPAQAVKIPAHSHVRILIDRGSMVAAYPALAVAGGRGASIKMIYAEALYDSKGKKGLRDEVGERLAKGIYDTMLADGESRVFEPLRWRVWRFLELEVQTQDAPLTLQGLATYETGYPFQQQASFRSSDAALSRIWDIGWRTARIDAHETYMDSAYWEQLQYVGDTRLQMLISYAVSGDDRLAVNAIDMIGWSDREGGLTDGAYPSRGHNVIAPFSLLWIAMLDDYYQRQPDAAVVTRNLPRARRVLDWYAKYLHPSNLLGKNPTWNFVDWVGQGANQHDVFPSYDGNGESCLTTLFYLGALQQMARMEMALGDPRLGAENAGRATNIKAALRSRCWSGTRGLFADDPSLTRFSQHSNSLAILYDVATREEANAIIPRILAGNGIDAPEGVITTTYYFAWYLARAVVHAGQGDAYLDLLKTWRDLLDLHYTTWPEERGNTRSDTHAWSAHPTADLLEIVAGVAPAAPGYARVRVAPHLGSLTSLDAVVQTPSGPVSVSYRLTGGKLLATIDKPASLPGVFSWRGRDYPLKQTRTRLNLAQ